MVQGDTENEKIVLNFFTTLGTGELERVRPLLHEEATWIPQVRDIPGAGVHSGKKGIIDEFLAPVRGMFAPGDPKIIIDTIASKGTLVFLETTGTGNLADGRVYDNQYAWAVEVKDGLVYKIREYMDSHYVARLFA